MSEASKNPFATGGFQFPDFTNGSNPVMQGLEMMNKVWSGLGSMAPSAITPTMSIEELDKRILELRAVENWLRVNQSMLQSTIQGLEVQRATLATLQSYAQTDKSKNAEVAAQQTQAAAQAWWSMMQEQFAQLTSAAAQGVSVMSPNQTADTSAKKTTARKRSAPKTSTRKKSL